MSDSLGLHRAIVKSTTDPAKRGRVLVAIPAIKAEPAWAALCVTSRGRSAAFAPAVGDEVVVAYLGGDMRSPVCLGWLWNPDSPPTGASDDPPNKMRSPSAT
jgi:hypothetical protein